MKDSDARRAAIVVGLFVALFGVRFLLDSPTYIGATYLLVLRTVLASLVGGDFFVTAEGPRGGRCSSARRYPRAAATCACSQRAIWRQ